MKDRIKQLRAECRRLIRELRAVAIDPPPVEDPCSAFRIGLRQHLAENLDIRAVEPKPLAMNVATVAAAYQLTRQGLHSLRQRHGIDIATFRDPDRVLEILLGDGRYGKTRSMLADSNARENIRKALQ